MTKDAKAAKRPVRMWVRLTQGQADYVNTTAEHTYRTPSQVVQMLLDNAILADGYREAAGKPNVTGKPDVS